KEYWQQIIDACFLNDDDPISTWKKVFTEIEYIRSTLSNMPITSLHISGEDVDLTVSMGKNRKWLGGGGRNIPSFEVFTSPDWRGTNGTIRFNQPLYRYGNLIKDISLEFKDGLVTNATASENEKLLKDMIQVENANKIGEFSLTDKRHSKITKFMGETLFDENMGGEFGNTHIALGMAYKDTHTNDPSTIADDIWEELGFNDSAVHTDIVSTTNRVVEATLTDGSQKIIYENGMFTL
ncbi:aminopeptidase, partial [candidate division WWE3 bacterium CG_4_9_14_3_um_filter_39_7]